MRAFEQAEREFQAELERRLTLTPAKEVLIFVHGYNNGFDDAAYTQAELWHFTGREGVPLLYTWPAGHGGLTGYTYDRESGEFTIFHLKQLLRSLTSFPSVEKIQILAHSRGTDVTTSALRELFIETRAAGEDPRQRFRIENLVLAAPDLDKEVIAQRIIAERLGPGVGQITVYTSKGDKALDAAQMLFDSEERLGQVSLEDLPPDALQMLKQGVNVTFIQFQGKSGAIGHGYFPAHPQALILLWCCAMTSHRALNMVAHLYPLGHIFGQSPKVIRDPLSNE